MADFETDDLWALVAGTFFLGVGLVIIVPIICLIFDDPSHDFWRRGGGYIRDFI